jgi:hypothetical protein
MDAKTLIGKVECGRCGHPRSHHKENSCGATTKKGNLCRCPRYAVPTLGSWCNSRARASVSLLLAIAQAFEWDCPKEA